MRGFGCGPFYLPQDCPEKSVFDAVMKWAGYGSEVVDASSACHPMQVGGSGAWGSVRSCPLPLTGPLASAQGTAAALNTARECAGHIWRMQP